MNIKSNLFAAFLALAIINPSYGEDTPIASKPASSSHADLAKQATNPLAPLIQFQVQNYFIFDSIDSNDYANQFIVQPVIPISATSMLPRAIFRPTIPIVTSPDVIGGPSGTTGLGDISGVYVFAFDQDWGSFGVGPAGAIPSATDLRVGARKWTLGPALFGMYTKIPKVQIGGLAFNTWAVGGGGPNDVNSLSIQPIFNYHFGEGWYTGWGDQAISFNWVNGTNYIPLSTRLGKVFSIGEQKVNMNGQMIYNVGDHVSGKDQWGFKLTVTLLFPE